MSEQYVNLANSLLAGSIDGSTNPITFSVNSGDGALFPTTANGFFRVTICDTNGQNAEVMMVTSRATDTFTASRGAGAALEAPVPTLVAHAAGSIVSHDITVGAVKTIVTELPTSITSITKTNYGDVPVGPGTATFTTSYIASSIHGNSFVNSADPAEPGVVLTALSSANDTSFYAWMLALPAAPYHMRARYRLNMAGHQYPMAGLCLYDGTKFAAFGNMSRNDTGRIRTTVFTNGTTFNGAYDQEFIWDAGWPGRDGLFDIEIVDDGTNRNTYVVADGNLVDKVLFFATTNTNFLVPTSGGIFIAPGDNSNGNRWPVVMKCIDFVLTTGT